MNVSPLAVVIVLLAAASLSAAEEGKTSARELLRARIAEDAKKADARKTASPAPATATSTSTADAAPASKAPAGTAQAPAPMKSKSAPAKEAPTVLPKMEVKNGRITELDQKLAKQEQDIAREKKNLKTSDVDSALNDAKIARPLAIFGGDSTQFRKGVASERVELMEAEKDLIEAIAHAKTKEEKAALQKQLDELRTMRRELDRSLR